MQRFLLPLLVCVLCVSPTACDETGSNVSVQTEATEASARQVTDEVMQKWVRSCALCHVSGVGGAPRVGVTEDWVSRLAQGKQTLMAHTIEGFNNMPPLGYCMSCERDDFAAMIDFMAGKSP